MERIRIQGGLLETNEAKPRTAPQVMVKGKFTCDCFFWLCKAR